MNFGSIAKIKSTTSCQPQICCLAKLYTFTAVIQFIQKRCKICLFTVNIYQVCYCLRLYADYLQFTVLYVCYIILFKWSAISSNAWCEAWTPLLVSGCVSQWRVSQCSAKGCRKISLSRQKWRQQQLWVISKIKWIYDTEIEPTA